MFAQEPAGSVDGHGVLVITDDRRVGLDGWWTKIFLIAGGQHHRSRHR